MIQSLKTRVMKPALLVTNNDYGRGLVKMYENAWKDGGPKIVSANFFQLTKSNFLPYLTKVKLQIRTGLTWPHNRCDSQPS